MPLGRTGPAICTFVAGALLFTAVGAQAEFVWDPEPDPVDITCKPDMSPVDCEWHKKFEAWWRIYGEKYDLWNQWLLFTPDVYFPEPHRKIPTLPPLAEDEYAAPDTLLSPQTPNLVDAIYQVALRRHLEGWAFAINDDAVLRMVRRKAEDEVDTEALRADNQIFPDSIVEVAQGIDLKWKFDEADLKTCSGAVAHLRAFPAQLGKKFWSDRTIAWLPGARPRKNTDYIIVAADGDGVYLRAASREDEGDPKRIIGRAYIVYDQANGGAGYDWAKRMAEIVEPCLAPSQATPPWKLLAQAAGDGEPLVSHDN